MGSRAGHQHTGWVLGTNGCCCYNSGIVRHYFTSSDDTKITVHLDMNKRTCAFTVNEDTRNKLII